MTGRHQDRSPDRPNLGTVRDWMTREPVCVGPETAAERVHRQMLSLGIRHVLVVDDDCLTGIVSHRDLRGAPAPEVPGTTSPTAVARVMTENPVTVGPEISLGDAVRLMLDRKIGALPVVDAGRPVGILTRADALEALLAYAEGVAGRDASGADA